MDSRTGNFQFTIDFTSPFDCEGSGTVKSADVFKASSSVCTDFPPFPGSHPFQMTGLKRKQAEIFRDDTKRASLSLVLGSLSSSSGAASKQSSWNSYNLSSAKDTDERSSIELGVSTQFNLGSGNAPGSPWKRTAGSVKDTAKRTEVDLRLSLSVGQSESVVTDTNPDPILFGNSVGISEGSTSSRWKCRSKLLPFLNATEKSTIVSPSKGFYCTSQLHGRVETRKAGQALMSPVDGSSEITGPVPHRYSSTKACQFPGCTKGARGSSGLCIAHGGGRRCEKIGCKKGAEGKTIFCKAHGGGRRCDQLGCTKSAEGRSDFCIAHGGGRRCNRPGCKKAARGKSGLCIKHGGGKRCRIETCTKSAEGHSGLCIAHGGGRRCQHDGCKKGAQGSTNFCKAHGGGKRCTFPDCTKGAEGSTPFCKGHGGGKRCSFPGGCVKSVHGGTQFCVAHGGGKRCQAADCTKSARGRTNFCVRHGGGKRCKVENCGKSAQGSTDFCKAHGGGKRCLFGQAGSDIGSGCPPCDSFSRGKAGLCAAHTPLFEDRRVHGAQSLGPLPATSTLVFGAPAGVTPQQGHGDCTFSHGLTLSSRGDVMNLMQPINPVHAVSLSIPEGRVRRGNIMTLFATKMNLGAQSMTQEESATTSLPRQWL